ncbi:hypothetical protein D3C71_88830 [compost metagenome]
MADIQLILIEYPSLGNKKIYITSLVPIYILLPFALMQKVAIYKSRLYKSLAKNQCVGRSQTRLTAFRQWFPTLSTEPMILLTPDL